MQQFRPAQSTPVLESLYDPDIEASQIEIPVMTVESVPGALPGEPSPKAVESLQLSLF